MHDLPSSPTDASVYLLAAHPNWRESRVNRRLLAAALDLPGVTVCDLYARYPDYDMDVPADQARAATASLIVLPPWCPHRSPIGTAILGCWRQTAPRRATFTAIAAPAQPATVQTEAAIVGLDTSGPAPPGDAVPPMSEPAPPNRATHYLWVVLIARIYEVFPLLCPLCGGQMRVIAFITHSADIHQIREHIGVDTQPPQIAPARGPPL